MALASTNSTTSILAINPIVFGAPKVIGIVTPKVSISSDFIKKIVIISVQVITKLILMTTIVVALKTIIALGSLEKNIVSTPLHWMEL